MQGIPMEGTDPPGFLRVDRALPADSAWALFLDVDGTLLDIAERPDAVRVPGGLADDLARLARRLSGALALISGRPVASLDALFAPLRLPAAGQHGAEIRLSPEGPVQIAPPIAALAGIAKRLAPLAAEWPGVAIESKGNTIAVHYRRAPAARAAIGEAVRAAVRAAGEGIEILDGKMVFELREPGITKGTAVTTLLGAAPFAGRRPVFVGDDVTDEDGFRAAEALGGIALPVGRHRGVVRRPAFADPAEVRAWLAARAAGA